MNKEYKKISSSRGLVKILKLWRGKDHLLLSEAAWFVERYRRFYFRDIQAFLISPSRARIVWNFIWGLSTILFVILGSSFKSESSLYVYLLGACCFSAFLINTALGPGCVLRLKTAIQNVELPVRRRRKAEKIIQLLRQEIEVAQQNLPEAPALSPVSPAAAAPGSADLSVGLKKFRPQAHWGLFLFLLLMAVTVGLGFFQRVLFLYLLEMTTYFGSIIFSVIAMIRQSKTDAPALLRKIAVATLFFVTLNYMVGIGWGYILLIQHPSWINDYWAMIKWIAAQPLEGSTFRVVFAGFRMVGASLLGIIGLLEMSSYQRRSR